MGSTNFNLGRSVENYIALVNQQGSLTSSDAAELSAHLFDAVDDLQRSGLTEEEAFTIACKRLGNEQLLDEEYSKVNTTLKTNKIWAYLLLGFNMFYTIPAIFRFLLSILYYSVYHGMGTTNGSVAIVTGVHLFICLAIIYTLRYKNSISKYIEIQVQKNSALITCLSFIPFLIVYYLGFLRVFRNPVREYLANVFNSSLVDNSYHLIFFTIAGAALALVFTIDKHERLSLKSLFERPSTLFLILFGVFTEVLASLSRSLPFDNILLEAVIFGGVYLVVSYIITAYNKQTSISSLLKFSVFGICAETILGICADIERGNTYFTIYFVSAMLLSILLGRLIALKTAVRTRSDLA